MMVCIPCMALAVRIASRRLVWVASAKPSSTSSTALTIRGLCASTVVCSATVLSFKSGSNTVPSTVAVAVNVPEAVGVTRTVIGRVAAGGERAHIEGDHPGGLGVGPRRLSLPRRTGNHPADCR